MTGKMMVMDISAVGDKLEDGCNCARLSKVFVHLRESDSKIPKEEEEELKRDIKGLLDCWCVTGPRGHIPFPRV